MSTPFQRALRSFAPAYMTGPNGGKLLDACAAPFDAMADRFWQARNASSVYLCEPEVLPYHARDRTITLYPNEPIASKRWRLAHWRQLHGKRGTHEGEMRYVQPFFLPNVLPTMRIVHTSGGGKTDWHTLSPEGVYSVHRPGSSNWNWDGQFSKWSRFWLIIDCTDGYPFAPRLWGDGLTWGEEGELWGDSLATVQTAKNIREAVVEWKSAHSRCEYIILDYLGHFTPEGSGAGYPAGNWNLWANRWPHAAYIRGH